MENLVVYKGIPCKLLAAEEPFPSRLQIISPNDISKAMQKSVCNISDDFHWIEKIGENNGIWKFNRTFAERL